MLCVLLRLPKRFEVGCWLGLAPKRPDPPPEPGAVPNKDAVGAALIDCVAFDSPLPLLVSDVAPLV